MKQKKNTKKELLQDSKTFCMAAWSHIHTTPSGVVAPCCIAESCATQTGMGNSRDMRLMEIVNSDQMKQLRVDMLNGVKNPECIKCHTHEENNITSFRQMINKDLADYFDEAYDATKKDGSLTEFKMRYFDIRFSNICNFKCRTCNSSFSTMWEQEDIKTKQFHARIVPKNDNPEFLQDVIEQIDYMKTAYFAGGEPLITEEHYILLEEMIRRGKTDIELRYNTNLSNLKFKDKDLLSLWKHFSNRVAIYASIDHYGERAEYIRHGTDWAKVEENFITAKKTPFIRLQMNTVMSVFNYLTLYEFYEYLVEKKLYDPKDSTYTLYNMSTPPHLTAHILPTNLKEIGKVKMEKLIEYMKLKQFRDPEIEQLTATTPWVFSQDTWNQYRNTFQVEVRRLDKVRGESFAKTFPELTDLLINERKARFPV